MHDWLLNTVVLPTIKSMAELCEKHGISFICYIEHKDDIVTGSITSHIQGDASEIARIVQAAAEGRIKNGNSSTKT